MGTVPASIGDASQTLNYHPFNINELPEPSASTPVAGPAKRFNLASILAYTAGAVFVLASSAMNVRYALGKADDLTLQIVWASVAVAASVALALAPSAIVQNLAQRKIGAASLAVGAMLLFGAYSVTAALGSATGGRLVAEIEAGDVAGKRKSANTEIEKAETELSSIGDVRPVATIDAEISRHMSSRRDLGDCTGWLPHVNARAVCITVADLKAERGRAERRSELENKITIARRDLVATGGKGTVANTDALALQGFAAAFGVTVGTDTINRLLVVLAVLVIELGGGLSFAVGQGLGNSGTEDRQPRSRTNSSCMRSPTSAPAEVDSTGQVSNPITSQVPSAPNVLHLPVGSNTRVSSPEAHKPAQTSANTGDAASNRSVQSLDVPTDPSGRLLQLLTARGGEVFGGQRSFARALGISHGHVANVLGDLVDAGKVRVVATAKGTRVRLV